MGSFVPECRFEEGFTTNSTLGEAEGRGRQSPRHQGVRVMAMAPVEIQNVTGDVFDKLTMWMEAQKRK